jgi:hypothetical protein
VGSLFGRRIVAVAALAVAAAVLAVRADDANSAGSTPATPPALTDAEVLASIHRGVDYLLKDFQQKLEPVRKVADIHRGDPNLVGDIGEFMLETYALLHVGADIQDPRLHFRDENMQVAVDVLTRADVNATYTTALQALALAELPQLQEVKTAMARAALRLTRGTDEAGGYTYTLENVSGVTHDQSNSQYGLLGVWAAADFGTAVPLNYWQATDNFWRAMQTPSGGWGYSTDGPKATPTDTMTAAGVASLFVCKEFLDRTPSLEPKPDKVLDDGLAALISGFKPDSNNYYYLYGVERVGLASGLKYLGQTNWYRTAAAQIVKSQQPDGSFSSGFPGANAVRSTCYALLFLVRGRAPVVMNKLSYDGPWNARPRDSANVHARLGRMLERHLNWQSVPVTVPYEEWLDAPLLLITGSKDPHFTAEDVGKFRKFVDAGGTIFSTADGNSQEFTDAMQRYATAMAGPNRAYRQLPPDHPLYTVFGKPKSVPVLFGVSNGLRELWIHSPVDLGAIWQSRTQPTADAWELPARLFFYAAGKGGLRSKLESLAVPEPETPPTKAVSVAQLSYAGNWDAEPGAWPRLAKLMALDAGAHTTVNLRMVPIGDLGTLSPPPALAHLAGTGKLVLTEQEQTALQIYVESGGTLFVEALGGAPEFASSAHELLGTLFPKGKLKTVPSNYLLYNGGISPDATKITSVEYRKFWILAHGASNTPRLEYLTVGGRIGVLFSAEDITSGLLGTNTWGISGYMPASAIALARDIVLFASVNGLKHKG